MDGRAKSTKINNSSHLSLARNEKEKTLLHKSTIRPVPGLLAKLTQSFVSYTVIFFLISAWRLYRTRTVLYDIVARAESTMTDNCQAVEKTMSVLAHSLPAIAAQGVNRGLVLAINSAIIQIGHGLEIVLVGIMATISWVISVLTGTWRCFLLHLSETRLPILSELGTSGVEALDQLNSALTAMMFMPLNDLGALIHREMAFPQFESMLVTAPMFTRVQFRLCDKIKDALSLEQLEKELDKMILYGVAVLVGIALFMVLAGMVQVWYQHRRWKLQIDHVVGRLSYLSGGQGNRDQGLDPDKRHGSGMVTPLAEQSLSEYEAMKISQMIKQPLLYRFVDSTSKTLFPKDKDKQRVYSWLINYVCTPPTMACLVLGLFGIVLVHCQIAFVRHMAANYRPLLSKPLVDITALVLETINDDMLRSASRNFAAETNRALAQLETDINTNVFGEIKRSSLDMGKTLGGIQTTLLQGVEQAFGNSPIFAGLVKAVLYCLVLNKMASLSAGLQWVEEHAHISFPRVSAEILVMDSVQVDQLIATALDVGQPSETDSGEKNGTFSWIPRDALSSVRLAESAAANVFSRYEDRVREELPMYYGLVGACGIVAVVGVIGAVAQYFNVAPRVPLGRTINDQAADV